MHLHWHRRDLRLADNPALAGPEGPTVGLFVLDPTLLSTAGAPRIAYLRGALAELRSRYREGGGRLLIRRGDPIDVVPDIAATLEVSAVSWERDYTRLAKRRDGVVRDRIEGNECEIVVADGQVLHPPGEITTADGNAYRTFSHFGRKWVDADKPTPAGLPGELVDPNLELEPLDSLEELGGAETDAEIPAAGPAAAVARLRSFCRGPIHRYAAVRDEPVARGTSRLSQDLHFGTIGIRRVWAGTEEALEWATDESDREGVIEFRRQLAWREFYVQALADRPDLIETPGYSFDRPPQWREDPEGFAAWKAGETGFPIVDAGMRQLAAEAYMHNRLRMIVASFLTKDLLIDWREGYRWFRECLVDHDTANDVGGWQWAGSVGLDPNPYFRVFNPMKQGKDYDPDARYIKRYIPELSNVAPETIHEWTHLDPERRQELAPDYPDPIVDHASRREAAIAMFEAARESD